MTRRDPSFAPLSQDDVKKRAQNNGKTIHQITRMSSSLHLKAGALGFFFLFLTSCAVSPPVIEMGLADAALRQARDIGVETKHPTLFTLADEAYRKADYYFRQGDYAHARTYAVESRQLVEQAELKVVEETGLVSAESEVLSIGVGSEDKEYFSE